MRELFENGAGSSPLDPQEAARQPMRPPLRKRFYEKADVVQGEGGFHVVLDGRAVRTPAKRLLSAPNEILARALAEEWNAQGEVIDPQTMPLTRLANSIIDGVTDQTDAVAQGIVDYLRSDLLFYRAASPEGLVARQSAHWDVSLDWASSTFGARFILSEGIMHVTQPEASVDALAATLPQDAWRLGALHSLTTLTGSALLALALGHRAITADAAWLAANVDEDWNSETWGEDAEAAARRALRTVDFTAAARVLEALPI